MRILILFVILALAGCHHTDDDNGPILPGDNEDKIFVGETDKNITQPKEESPDDWKGQWNEVEGYEIPNYSASQSVGQCSTYTFNRVNSGRRFLKINEPLWKRARSAAVTFSDGYRMNVILAKANRTRAGAVVRPGSTTPNIVAVWQRYGGKAKSVTFCLR